MATVAELGAAISRHPPQAPPGRVGFGLGVDGADPGDVPSSNATLDLDAVVGV